MSNPTNVGDNPNDKMPAGKPLHPDQIVPEDDAGSAAIEDETAAESDDQVIAEEFEGLDNDLVNVGKFTDPEADAGSPDAKTDHADRSDVASGPASDSLDTIRKPSAP